MTFAFNYNDPLPISDKEWDELAAHPTVRDNWYLDETEGGKNLASQVYGVKFDYQFDVSPLARTDLYVLVAWMGAGVDGDANNVVIMLCRNDDGTLEPLALLFPDSMRSSS